MSSEDMSVAFMEIATDRFKPDAPSKPCPDQWVEAIGTIKNEVRHNVHELPSDGRRLVLVLESPHKDEFKEPKGPAKGFTGKNICRHLDTALEKVGIKKFETGDRLILINAIQYQCSLGKLGERDKKHGKPISEEDHTNGKLEPGEDYKNRRDRIFRDLFCCPDFADDFVARLKKIVRPGHGDIVINCCTKGETRGQDNLRDLVCKELRRIEHPHFHLTHPSSWPRAIPKNERECPYP